MNNSVAEVARLLDCAESTAQGVRSSIGKQLERRLLLGELDAWRLKVGVSQAGAEAGEGVRLLGSCEAGTVLASYPGVTYAAEDLPVMHQLVLKGNDYVVARRDGTILDGRCSGPSKQIYETALMRDAASGAPSPADRQDFAIAQKVNHPPPGVLPNVLLFPFDLGADEHAGLHPFLGVYCFRPPAEGAAVKQGAVLIACRRLHDEELWLDYKLGLDGPLEPWYHPVVYGEHSVDG
jgi:hypothetical protein